MTTLSALLLRVFAPFAVGYFLSFLFRAVNAVLAPELLRDLGMGPSALGLLTATYFIAFASFQLPLGVLLDRFGPRRVEAALLMVAAVGAFSFARAETLGQLIVGRALIGLGVSACLMAAFKAYTQWFASEHWPLVNGFQMAAGGLGALAATSPVQWLLPWAGWRGIFLGLALCTLMVAGLVFFLVPEKETAGKGERFRDQLRGIGEVFASSDFWRIAPLTGLSQATLFAVQGLWASPWLKEVGRLEPEAVVAMLFWIALAMVAEMSGGAFQIKVEGAEKHKAPLEILDMVKGGQFEMGHTASYYWKGKDATTALFTTVPFGMTASEQGAWLYYGGGLELMQKCYDKFGVLSLPGGNTGVQMGGWFKKEIKTLDDLKGLKMRIPSVAGEVFAKLGVSVINIAPGELYTALDRGAIDALEWVGPGMDIKMGFHKIAPYYYAGWHEPASDMQFLISKKAYEQLPAEYKAMLHAAIKAASADMYFDNFAQSAQAWATMKTEYPAIKVMTFPEPVLAAMKKASDEVLDGYAAKDPFFKEVLESQRPPQPLPLSLTPSGSPCLQ